MKSRLFVPFFVLAGLILLVGLACGTVTTPTPTQPAVQIQPTPGGGNIPLSGAVSSLDDVRSATIQIEAQGSFIDPEFGPVAFAGAGSGFIIDPAGIAVTNNHVVTGAALLKVWVGGNTGRTYNAKVLGVSECSDLAVIDIEGDGFPYLQWRAGPISVGLDVYAAGFPLGDPEFTLTKGIVSKERAGGESNWASVDAVIEHDTTTNPGNSGGPLMDGNGQVVGIHYAVYREGRQAFAIGREVAIPIIEELRSGKDVDSIGVNGIAVISEDGSLSGIWVASVKSGSPADKAGIQPGDILYQLEGLVLATDGTMKDYCDVIRSHKPSDTLLMTVIRYATGELLEGQLNGRTLEVTGTFDTGGVSGSTDGTTGGTGEAPDYFTEEFDDLIPNWTYDVKHGDATQLDIHTDNGVLVFNVTGQDLYAYLMYDPYIYKNVRIDAFADNRGKNTNDVMLVCRYSEEGWYEFNISNGGLWTVYVYDKLTGGGYQTLKSGGSKAIRSGRQTNEYTAICNGNTLSLYINGVETTSFTEKKYSLRDGQVGIGVSSYSVLPIIVEFDWVTISEP